MIWNREGKIWYSSDMIEKIKIIAEDIAENDCYENSDVKAVKILNIIEGKE